MIFCNIEELKKYKSISKNLSTAIDFILKTDLHNLPMGRTEIDGENVYVTKMEIVAKEEDALPFEAHRKYMDIHVDLEGQEVLCISNHSDLLPLESYKVESDYELFNSEKNTVKVILKNKSFVIIDVCEAHKPGIFHSDKKITKCVFKILAN